MNYDWKKHWKSHHKKSYSYHTRRQANTPFEIRPPSALMYLAVMAMMLALLLWCAERTHAQSSSGVGFTRFAPALTFEFPVEILPANDGTQRLFVVSQNGSIWVFRNSSSANTASRFLNIGTTGVNRIVFSANEERGLLGMALHPNFRFNGEFFVYYTTTVSPTNTTTRMVLARYRVNPANPDQALPDSEERLLVFDKNQANTNHNGGKIAFGPDGLLYLSVGDGGGAGDPQNNAQNLTNLFGKLIRIDVQGDDFPADPQRNYRIPLDNPFASAQGGARPEIFAWGLRNTWKFCFDDVGRIWGGDVGQGAWEEVNIITRGANYGWRRFEGNAVYRATDPVPSNPAATFPIHVYSSIGGASITGGYVYRGTQIPSLRGKYVYADYVRGTVSALTITGTPLSSATVSNEALFTALDGTSLVNITSFGEDEQGEIYMLGRNGRVYRLTNTAPSPAGRAVNGIGSWAALAAGVNGTVHALAADSVGNIYVGGAFTIAGNVPALNIARWNPTTGWSALGSGVPGVVQAIAVRSSAASGASNAPEVFVGGAFAISAGTGSNAATGFNVARWDGTAWTPLGGGVDGPVRALALNEQGVLFVGGGFSRAGSVSANNIAQWDGSRWNALGNGTNNEIRALVVDKRSQSVIAGGNFSVAGAASALCVAEWNGVRWNALGSGTNGFVNALAFTPRGELIAGGSFTNAGGVAANRIARWNGSAWSPLANASGTTAGDGLSGTVNALVSLPDGSVLAGGAFLLADGAVVNNIALWNPATGWNALGMLSGTSSSSAGATVGGVGTSGGVNALVVPYGQASSSSGSAVSSWTAFAGGSFTSAGGSSAANVARLSVPSIITSVIHGARYSGQASYVNSRSIICCTFVPTPSASSMQMRLTLSVPERVRVSIIDIAGREVLLCADEELSAGDVHRTLDVHALPSGVYWCRVSGNNGSCVSMVVVSK